jgi:hypothetical protein
MMFVGVRWQPRPSAGMYGSGRFLSRRGAWSEGSACLAGRANREWHLVVGSSPQINALQFWYPHAEILPDFVGNPVRYTPSSAPHRARFRILVFPDGRRGKRHFSLFTTHQFCDGDVLLLHVRTMSVKAISASRWRASDHHLQLELLVALE